jgi:streptogramin lyase
MSITYAGGGLNEPDALAADSKGSVWVANFAASNITNLSPTSAAWAISNSTLEESFGITVDSQDNIWVTNQQSSDLINNGDGSITKFNSLGQVQSGNGYIAGGIYYPAAVAADAGGSVWVADFGRSATTILSGGGSSLSGNTGYQSQSLLPFPSSIALDAAGNAWFGAESRAAKVTPSGSITSFDCCQSALGVAVDQSGSIWLSDYLGSSIVELDPSGSITQTVTAIAGITNPKGIAVDGNGSVWVANYEGASFSGVTGAASGPASSAISPSAGFGLDANLIQPVALALDASGNLWIADSATNSVVQFVGIVAPVATPHLGPPTQP